MQRSSHGFMAILALTAVLLSGSLFAQEPPTDLSGTVLPGGIAQLEWLAPVSSLQETFDSDSAATFAYDPEDVWSVDEGFLKGLPSASWKSAWYEGAEYSDFVVETTFLNVIGNNSRGLLFRSNGGRDYDFTGYCFYVAYNGQNFALYGYSDGVSDLLVGWTPSDLINTGVGQSNTLSVVTSGTQIELYINGVAVAQLADDTADEGYVGVVSSGSNEVWFDDLLCYPGESMAQPFLTRANANVPQPVVQQRSSDEEGVGAVRHVAHREPVPDDGLIGDPVIAEVLGYRIYRDNEMVGISTSLSYQDTLPGLGTFDYTVTAHHAGVGESAHSQPITLTWQPISLNLTSADTVLPAVGGTITYSVHLMSNLQQAVQGANFWVTVLLPGGQVVQPSNPVTFTMPPFMDTTLTGLTQQIPPFAPSGTYSLRGHLGFYPNAQVTDAFAFVKLDAYGGGGTLAPLQNVGGAGGNWLSDLGEWNLTTPEASTASPMLPETASLSSAFPNPFNGATTVSVHLPRAAELKVVVYDVLGRHVSDLAADRYGAGDHRISLNAADWASGVYLLHATVNGRALPAEKLVLLR